MRSKFKDEHKLEKRKAEADRIRQKYADRIPVRRSSHLYPPNTIANKHLGHLRESREVRHRNNRQEEVSRPCRSDSWPIRLCYSQANQAQSREGHLHLRR